MAIKKDSLIKGTIILTLAAFVARFLGVVQRIPLKHLLDDTGMATYAIAYNIYFALLIVATAGFPSALSKLISERYAIGEYAQAARIFRAAVWFALTAGFVSTVLLYAAAPYYALRISEDPDAVLAIRALAPALLLFPLIAIMRGYFQGRQMMTANGMSQIVEQILRVLTAVGLALLLLLLGYGHVRAVAGASFGGVMGSIGAFAVMFLYWRKLRKEDEREGKLAPSAKHADGSAVPASLATAEPSGPAASHQGMGMRQIYWTILKISIPISLISLAVPLINFIDSSTVIPLLKQQLGDEGAKAALGILAGRAQSLAGIPIILAIALSQSVVPVISSAFARGDLREVGAKASQALRISVLSGLPVVLALVAGARPVNGLLFADTNGTGIIAMLTAASMFQILMMTSAAIMMGLGQMRAPTVHVFAGIALKLAGSFALAPYWGIYGILAATTASFMLTMLLNLAVLRRTVDYVVLGRRWTGMLLAAAVMLLAGFGLDRIGEQYLHPSVSAVNFLLQSALVGIPVLLSYPLLLMLFKVVTEEDFSSMPAIVRKWMLRLGIRLRSKVER
ncbi:putative polysaccharide biosynthesis protein [Ferviditalea candida]|uniref:Polysaccharide biosynthesis protein n=1 Tax=Ferviditalea candida TaxID=3108399 RepID=A0ABU5ZDA4_9BACL|nr:polysaccharide biosynthesis protein [Paenibacillaceae bacterium T2]